jgi:hypothetical protein
MISVRQRDAPNQDCPFVTADRTRMTAERFLVWLLRINAGVLLLALPCALLPFAWMDAVHREALGLGQLADLPITRYMARSLSLVYALHGCVIVLVLSDWPRYRPAVPVLAWLHVALGWAMLAVDLDAGMPWYWTAAEGPSLVAFASLILITDRRARRSAAQTAKES